MLILITWRTFEFATTAQKNEFKCTCELSDKEKVDIILRIDMSDEYTPEVLQRTIFNVEINNTSVPCRCGK